VPTPRPDQRAKLLDALRTGLSRESALAKVGLRERDLPRRFRAEVAAAERQGSAFVESMLLQHAMRGDGVALRLFMEGRRAPADEPTTLAELFRSMEAPARDQMRGAVEAAIERAKREVRVSVTRFTDCPNCGRIEVPATPAAGGSPGAAAVAGHPW
jgi:hypothetical protein